MYLINTDLITGTFCGADLDGNLNKFVRNGC